MVSAAERAALQQLAQQAVTANVRLRCRIVLASDAGASNATIAVDLGVGAATVGKWRDRFIRLGVAGLFDAARSGRPRSQGRAALQADLEPQSAPSSRQLAVDYRVSQSTAARASREEHRQAVHEPVPAAAHRLATPTSPRTAVDSGVDPLPGQTGLLSDRLYTTLRSWILRGDLAPGQRVVESEIARTLGTSPTPAREAIRRLAHEGLVTNRPHIGHFVTRTSPVQAREAREVRVMLETAAARRAAGRLPDANRAALDRELAHLADAAERNDIGAFRDADMRFHREAVTAGGNSMLIRVWQLMEPVLWDLQAVSDAHYSGDWHQMARMHSDLIDVLVNGDPEEAARLFSAHARGEGTKVRPARIRRPVT